MFEIHIDSPYLVRSASINYRNPFYFYINDKKWKTSVTHASIISSIVFGKLQLQSNYSEIKFNMPIKCKETLEIFDKLINGQKIHYKLSEEACVELYEFGNMIGNEDFMKQYKNYFEKLDCTIENYQDYTKTAKKLCFFDKVVQFIINNFTILGKNELISILFDLGYYIAELVFSSSDFKCVSEDYAVSIILALANKGLEYLELLKYSFLDFCKSSTIMEVIEFIEKIENFTGYNHLIAFFKKLISKIKDPHQDNDVKERSLDNDSVVPAVFNEICGKYSKELGEIRNNHESFCIEMLSIMPKTREYFSKIYKILEYSSKENLDAVIKYAYENGYCKVLDNSGNDAFLNASKQNNFKLCKKLHLLGFDVNSRCSFGNSVLIWFALRNNLKAVKYFSNFVDVNDVNCMKGSPLYYATRDGYLDIVEYLCSLPNINVNIVNSDGKTPLSIAKSDSVRSILLQHNAKL